MLCRPGICAIYFFPKAVTSLKDRLNKTLRYSIYVKIGDIYIYILHACLAVIYQFWDKEPRGD